MRRTRHRRRFHTDRIVRNRRARYFRELPDWERGWLDQFPEWYAKRLGYGALADRDPWDCGGHCHMCHWEKFTPGRRSREARLWRRDWGLL